MTGILLFSRAFGVLGAAAALLVAELIVTVFSAFFAKRWLDANGIAFPWGLLQVALTSIAVAMLSILCMVIFARNATLVMTGSLAVNLLIAVAYYRALPALATAKVRGMLLRRRGKG